MGEEVVSSQVPSFPRDFLRRFGAVANGCSTNASLQETEVGGGGAFLSLDLSLGGCFGAEAEEARLARSSSIAALPACHELPSVVAPPSLARTCSLPAETEEILRKRKQLQSLKRLEAKRKRLERKSSSKPAVTEKNGILGSGTENGRSTVLANGSLPPWSLRNRHPRPQSVDGSKTSLPALQAPVGSHGSISSGVCDDNVSPTSNRGFVASESKETPEVKSQSKMSEQSNDAATKHPAAPPGPGERNGGGARKGAAVAKAANGLTTTKAAERSIMESMPCVSTRGDGPNGRRIEGFLYKYRKGEEVRIVCVCHGRSLTPTEFVKHAGGGDVAHPLRHIVVSPSPMALL